MEGRYQCCHWFAEARTPRAHGGAEIERKRWKYRTPDTESGSESGVRYRRQWIRMIYRVYIMTKCYDEMKSEGSRYALHVECVMNEDYEVYVISWREIFTWLQ
jgi:hypothetical protein